MQYNKLVRDKIPEIIKERGAIPKTYIANNDEYWKKLKEKLIEETNEFIVDNNEEELADILEVIEAICSFKKIDRNKLEKIKLNKAKTRGGFRKKIILEGVKEQ